MILCICDMKHVDSVYLISSSPRRKEILEMFTTVEIITPMVNEASIAHLGPEAIAIEKLRSGMDKKGIDRVYIAADTVIEFNGRIIGKPQSPEDACSILRNLSGREHSVISGFALGIDGKIFSGTEKTVVRFRKLSDDLIRKYVSTGEPMDKAGAYGIQALGSILVDSINGDFFNVVGLPLKAIEEVLEENGLTLMPEKSIGL